MINYQQGDEKGDISSNHLQNVKFDVVYSSPVYRAKIFREIGLADELGSGVRNITNYSEIYFGRKTVFEDGSIFKATVFLKAQDKAQDNLIKEIIEFCKNEKNIFK